MYPRNDLFLLQQNENGTECNFNNGNMQKHKIKPK